MHDVQVAWIDTIEFPEPWVDLRSFRQRVKHRELLSNLRRELHRELSPKHELSTVRWTIVGAGVPARDDVLLRLDDESVALTHLTWKRSQEALPWPSTTRVWSLEQFRGELIDRGYELS